MTAIFQVIQEDHRQLRTLFEQIDNSDQPEQIKPLFHQLKELLLTHAKTEEKTFYESLKQHDLNSEVTVAEVEHAAATKIAEQLDGMAPDNIAWKPLFKTLRVAVEHHMNKEEDEIFSKYQNKADMAEAERVGTQMRQMEQEFGQQPQTMTGSNVAH